MAAFWLDKLKELYDFIGAGMDIMESVSCALAMVDLVDGYPVRCAIFCANLGGDADAIGTMAGAISGCAVSDLYPP
ncbi:ADP-ribosylglycohydrolase family protein [Photorhabdus cinerea]